MDWGLLSGCTALIGLIISLIRIGEWKAKQEVRIENIKERLESSDSKIEAIAVLQSQQNLLLTEIKTKLEFLIANKTTRKKTDVR